MKKKKTMSKKGASRRRPVQRRRKSPRKTRLKKTYEKNRSWKIKSKEDLTFFLRRCQKHMRKICRILKTSNQH